VPRISPDAPSRPRTRRRAGLIGLVLVLLVGAAAVLPGSPAGAQTAPPDGAGAADERPEHEMVVDSTTPDLAVVPVHDAPVSAMSAAELDAIDATAAHEPERQVASATGLEPFALVGVGFEGGAGEPVLLRVEQADGSWSEWVSLEVGGHEGEGAVEQPADGQHHAPTSDPIWVEDATGYEVDLPADASDVQVHLVREGEALASVAAENGAAAIGPAAGQPAIRSRSQWGAAPYNGTPDYAYTLIRAVVHHTVNGNDYSQAQVPGMIRGIQSYHQGANGWSDIGYNFVVDRFGTIWEGRQGGVDRPVIGAHAENYNTGAVGVSVLGEFTSVAPPEAVINSLQVLIGWKLALHGTTPSADNVLGHRNVGQTACPGQRLYDRIPDVRFGALLYFNTISDPCYGSSAEPFCDVQPGHPFEDDILWVHDQGIADGYADGTFRPGAPVSRQAMAAFLYRLAGLPATTPPATASFSDVGTGHQFFDEIEWAVDEGITTGYSNGRFLPLASISRQAMAAFMYRFAGEPAFTAPGMPAFSDVAVGRPFYDEIHWLDAEGISEGYVDGTFRPDANVSRQAMAAFLHRLDGLAS
jgi:hypothetical protein